MKNRIPETQAALLQWMEKENISIQNYSISGSSITEGHGIECWGGLWIWYYTERDLRENIKYFDTEKEVVEWVFNYLMKNE